jgi:ABC-type transport system involved in multi-copper enzyme maturation permease subunit
VKKIFAITKEELFDKKFVLVSLGVLIGLLGLYLINLLNTLDLSGLQAYLDTLPESLLALLGPLDITNPYSLLNAYFFSFLWLYCGVFLVYMASNLVPQEVENNTIDLVLSKSVSREKYLTGKIVFLYVFTACLIGLILVFVAAGMGASSRFIEAGLRWERLGALFLAATLHLGTLAMTAVFFSTVFLSTKKTIAAAVITMFLMFFIGGSYGTAGAAVSNPLRYASTWFYYNPAQYFGTGNFGSFLGDVLVLLGVNLGLIIASLIVFRKRDIPV